MGNLAWGVDDLTLENLFREQGNVVEAKVVYDRESGKSRGFGFVTYNSAEEVNNAIQSLDGVVSSHWLFIFMPFFLSVLHMFIDPDMLPHVQLKLTTAFLLTESGDKWHQLPSVMNMKLCCSY